MFYKKEFVTQKKNFYKNYLVSNAKCDVILLNSVMWPGNSELPSNPYFSETNISTLIPTTLVLGDIAHLKTRFIYQCTESIVSWDKKLNIKQLQ